MVELTRYRPNLWLTEVQLADFAVRGAVIQTATHLLIWDTLSHPRDMEAVTSLIDNRQVIVVYSHADWDHIWGTKVFLPQHPTVIGHDACEQRFHGDVPKTLNKKQRAKRWRDVELVPPAITFNDGLVVHLGGVRLELHHLEGHTADCIVGYIPEWGILLAGDTVETPLPVVNDASKLDVWLKKLQGWANNGAVQTVIPSHGRIGGREIIEENIAYLQSLQSDTAAQLADLDPFYQQTHDQNLALVNTP